MPKTKFKETKFGKIVIGFTKGVLKEAVSYVPIVGDNLANGVENAIGTGIEIQDPATERASEYVGKALPWIIGGLLIYFKVITFEQLSSLLDFSE